MIWVKMADAGPLAWADVPHHGEAATAGSSVAARPGDAGDSFAPGNDKQSSHTLSIA